MRTAHFQLLALLTGLLMAPRFTYSQKIVVKHSPDNPNQVQIHLGSLIPLITWATVPEEVAFYETFWETGNGGYAYTKNDSILTYEYGDTGTYYISAKVVKRYSVEDSPEILDTVIVIDSLGTVDPQKQIPTLEFDGNSWIELQNAIPPVSDEPQTYILSYRNNANKFWTDVGDIFFFYNDTTHPAIQRIDSSTPHPYVRSHNGEQVKYSGPITDEIRKEHKQVFAQYDDCNKFRDLIIIHFDGLGKFPYSNPRNLFFSFEYLEDLDSIIGQEFSIKAILLPSGKHVFPDRRESDLALKVEGSFDPNDMVSPIRRIDNRRLKNGGIEYTVYFANIGAGTARDVELKIGFNGPVKIKEAWVTEKFPDSKTLAQGRGKRGNNTRVDNPHKFVTDTNITFYFNRIYLQPMDSCKDHSCVSEGYITFQVTMEMEAPLVNITADLEIIFDHEDPVCLVNNQVWAGKQSLWGIVNYYSPYKISLPGLFWPDTASPQQASGSGALMVGASFRDFTSKGGGVVAEGRAMLGLYPDPVTNQIQTNWGAMGQVEFRRFLGGLFNTSIGYGLYGHLMQGMDPYVIGGFVSGSIEVAEDLLELNTRVRYPVFSKNTKFPPENLQWEFGLGVNMTTKMKLLRKAKK